jgi:hypothetical protein
LAANAIDKTYSDAEHGDDSSSGESTDKYHWTDAGAKPEENVWANIPDKLYPGKCT